MRIRDLNNEGGELSIISDNQGDSWVTIYTPQNPAGVCVRVGGFGSGHFIPPKISMLLLRLADEFKKYADCKYENEAFEKFLKERDYD